MHTAPAPSGHPTSTTNDHPGVTAAARRHRAAESALADAASRAGAARAAERIAADAKAGADAHAGALRSTHGASREATARAEAAWQGPQTDVLWDAVEAARGAESKAALRLRQAEGAAELAAAELDVARRRAESAAADERAAAVELDAAARLLDAQRRSARELSEAEAARAAAAAREAEALDRDRDAWHADVARELVPRVERYLRAALELRAAEVDLEPALRLLRDRGRNLAHRAGMQSGAVPADLDLRAGAADVLNLAVDRASRALDWRAAWKRSGSDAGPWGDAPFARPKSYTRDATIGGRNALFDTIHAAIKRVGGGR